MNELEELELSHSRIPEVPKLSVEVESTTPRTKKLKKSKVRFASTTSCDGCCNLECPKTPTPKKVSEEVLKKLAELPRYGRREAWRAKMEGLREEAEGLDPEEDGGPPQLDPSDDETERDSTVRGVEWTVRRGRWARRDKDVSQPPRPPSAAAPTVVQSPVERAESGSEESESEERPWTEVERGKKKMWRKKAETRQSLEKLQTGLEGNESRRQREWRDNFTTGSCYAWSDPSKLNLLGTVYPEGINAVGNGGWEEITMYVDSGATETVMSEDMLMSIALTESIAMKQGVTYEVANGIRIANLGEKRFEGVTEDGGVKNITAQVCSVNKALLSVSKAVKAGNRVIFDDEGSYIENKVTGEVTWLVEEGGMYALKMWVKAPF
jgi:hypothetical protein